MQERAGHAGLWRGPPAPIAAGFIPQGVERLLLLVRLEPDDHSILSLSKDARGSGFSLKDGPAYSSTPAAASSAMRSVS